MQWIVPFFEVLIIAIILNTFFSFFWRTKSIDLIWGFFGFFVLYALASWLNFPVLQQIMLLLGNTALIAFLVIFQPELRLALSKLSLKGKHFKEISELDRFLELLSTSIYRMAEKKTGALVAIENEDSLEEYAQKSVLLNANFSPELLETIFSTNTPLHDGAVIIRNTTILAAAAILPLADDTYQLTSSMGTRHRAALGLSYISDALIIVVSEETGKVSIARDGIITRGIKVDRFKGILRSVLSTPHKVSFSSKFNLREWLKQ